MYGVDWWTWFNYNEGNIVYTVYNYDSNNISLIEDADMEEIDLFNVIMENAYNDTDIFYK